MTTNTVLDATFQPESLQKTFVRRHSQLHGLNRRYFASRNLEAMITSSLLVRRFMKKSTNIEFQ